MKLTYKSFTIALLLGGAVFGFAHSVTAAAPDGAGPWADSILSSSQGLMKNGGAVPAIRSDPTTALGVAEFTLTDGDFFSLGFGGIIALGFDNGVSNGAIIVETTNPGYPGELASVAMSEDGVTWVTAGTVNQDGIVNQPDGVTCARFVRITDVSDPNAFPDDIADGYDVDGVQATGDPCPSSTSTPTPTPTSPPSNPSTPSNPGSGGDGQSDGKSDGASSGGGGTTATAATTSIGSVVPGFPNTGQCSTNPLIPCLPDTGIGPDNNISWVISAGAFASLAVFFLARRAHKFSSLR